MLERIDIRTAMLAAALALGAGSAAAQEYCVACSEPDAVYRCIIEGAQPGGAQPLQMQCVTAMAKAGGHATCGVRRGTVFQCDGPIKRVPWIAAGEETPAPIATPKPSEKPADPAAPPKTMLELTDRASKKTADDMKKAGETMKEGAQNLGDGISSGAKKTWECISSLFFKC
jgi:hypothetical protein